MPCDIQAPADPDVGFAFHIVEEARKAGRSARMAKKPHMHAHRHCHIKQVEADSPPGIDGLNHWNRWTRLLLIGKY